MARTKEIITEGYNNNIIEIKLVLYQLFEVSYMNLILPLNSTLYTRPYSN